MKRTSKIMIKLSIFPIILIAASIACNRPDAAKVIMDAAVEHCFPVSREEYEISAEKIGVIPETPKYPESAIYEVCQVEGQTSSVRMTDGEQPDEETAIPVGTYDGETTFYTTLEDDIDDSYLEPVCTENTIQVVIGSDGVAQGEIRSFCYSKQATDNEEMQMTYHSEVTGLVQGELLNNAGQLSIVFTWHTYFTSPQWETPSLDQTVDFEFPYNVNILNEVMTLTPAGETEDYYKFVITKQ